jgi:hypothetical protein
MTRPRRRPSARAVALSPDTLGRAPHLGVLDVVDHALRITAWSMYAEFPELIGDPHPWHPEPPDLVAARRLLRQIASFARVVERYRRTLAPLLASPQRPPPDDDVDF